LFFSTSKTWEKDFEKFRSGRALKLLGYDTLEGQNWENASVVGDAEKKIKNLLDYRNAADEGSLRADAGTIIERSHNLIERVGKVLKAHNVSNGTYLTFKQCEELIEAGVVVELLLLPMERLRDVIQWRFNNNII
jgi:hypothetical protein